MNIRYQIKIHKEKTLGMAQIVHLKEDSFLVTNPTTLHAMQCSAWVFPSFQSVQSAQARHQGE